MKHSPFDMGMGGPADSFRKSRKVKYKPPIKRTKPPKGGMDRYFVFHEDTDGKRTYVGVFANEHNPQETLEMEARVFQHQNRDARGKLVAVASVGTSILSTLNL